jgi:outer membrane protein OmpA-like peptidoglycan-associated protein
MGDSDLASLRAMLLGPEQDRLDALQARLDDPDARAEDIGAVLPRVLLQHAQDPNFARALTPPLEQAITASVQRNPKPLSDALFPVMGPAIRKAVSAGLAGMVESLNRTLEYSLSARSIRWRLEAVRTGKPFAEVVLLKTLLYRIEQVFLIDRRTGLLLQHVHASAIGVQDADMVSGMLTAIRDFVQQSFRTSDAASLDGLAVGNLSVLIEAGPHALLATVVRGTAPTDVRKLLQDTLESIHLQFGEPLAAFDGDASTLDPARPTLEACLYSQFRAEERKPRRTSALILIGAVALALVIWIGFSWRAYSRWNGYVSALRTEPGLVVVSSGREGGKYVVSGMRDPLARDPSSLLAAHNLSADDVAFRWAPYQGLEPPLIAARAEAVLHPPDGVSLSVKDGVLSASGAPPATWVAEAARLTPFIAGLTRFDASGALDSAMRSAIGAIESEALLFVKGASRLAPGQEDALAHLVKNARDLDALAAASGQRLHLEIVGHTDADGPDQSNVPLSRARAETIAAALGASTLTHLDIAPTGVGSQDPAVAGQAESDKQRNRRATIHVTRGGR